MVLTGVPGGEGIWMWCCGLSLEIKTEYIHGTCPYHQNTWLVVGRPRPGAGGGGVGGSAMKTGAVIGARLETAGTGGAGTETERARRGTGRTGAETGKIGAGTGHVEGEAGQTDGSEGAEGC